jgi:hypothetical protein
VPAVPGFQHDLFISYAHKNDKPWSEGGVGWVTEFIQTLKAELEAKEGDFSLWNDPALRTGEDFNDAIGKAISESAVFLSVLSPAYDNSWYCKKEVEEFRKLRHPAFGMKVGTLSRMQAIVFEDLPQDRWPPELRTTSPYRFYSPGVVRIYKPKEPDEKDPYIQGLWKVRESILATLDVMRKKYEDGTVNEHRYDFQANQVSGTATVCLAEVADDLYDKRESLRTALEQLKEFQVCTLSEAAVPSGPAVLSVHLFGKLPGRPVPGEGFPTPRLQLQAALAGNPARRPLVWLARDLKLEEVDNEAHKQFLESFLNHNGIELLRMGFEDLKEEIQRRMRPRTSPVMKPVRRVQGDPIVHIWHGIDDVSPLASLKQCLKERNCGISVFPYLSLPKDKLQSKVAFCDGLIVPYTTETKTWAEDVVTEAFQLHRCDERPTAFAAVELPPPAGTEFNFEHPKVFPVRGTPTGDFQGIDEFLARLEE